VHVDSSLSLADCQPRQLLQSLPFDAFRSHVNAGQDALNEIH
jgi:hypothetical protein